MLFVVDVSREGTAIHEANLLNIPVVAMVDTNCDPSNVDYVIPSNDDAIRAIKLVVGKIADAALEGLGARKEEIVEEEVLTVARVGVEEAELSDEELLGEATLAKLVTHPKDIAEGEIEELAVDLEEEKGDEFELAEEEVSELIGEEESEEPAIVENETEAPVVEEKVTEESVPEVAVNEEPVAVVKTTEELAPEEAASTKPAKKSRRRKEK
jgi:hypothetical protein